MPTRTPTICTHPGCNARAVKNSRCAEHPHIPRNNEGGQRPNVKHSHYGAEWRKIRAEVLTQHGIPKADWPMYDVDHTPPYDPGVEPNHRMYALTPMLRSAHSTKTASENGGFGNPKRV